MSEIFSNASTISIKITSTTGTEIDATEIFLSVSIFQSLINRKFINGRLLILDSIDLLNNFPFIGNEQVTIKAKNSYDNNSIDYKFRVYKIDRDVGTLRIDQRFRVLNIYLYTDEERANYTKISKKFTGTGSSIISDIVLNNFQSTKTILSEVDSTNLEFMSNFWNADRCIDYICKNTKSTYSDYIFYENLYGYNFKSLSSLFSEDPKNTIKFEIQEPYLNIDNVQQYQFNSFFDDLMWRKRGMFGNTLYKLSNDEYKFEIDQKDIEIIDDDINHSGSNRLYNNDVIDGLNDVLVDMNEDPNINIIRTTHFNLLNRYNLVVNLNGDLNRNVGEIYNLDFPSLDNESGNQSDSFAGKWIAMEINTTIFKNFDMKQNICLAKNAFFNNNKIDSY